MCSTQKILKLKLRKVGNIILMLYVRSENDSQNDVPVPSCQKSEDAPAL